VATLKSKVTHSKGICKYLYIWGRNRDSNNSNYMICLVEAQVETLKIIFKLYGSHFTISYLIWIIGLGMENIYKH